LLREVGPIHSVLHCMTTYFASAYAERHRYRTPTRHWQLKPGAFSEVNIRLRIAHVFNVLRYRFARQHAPGKSRFAVSGRWSWELYVALSKMASEYYDGGCDTVQQGKQHSL